MRIPQGIDLKDWIKTHGTIESQRIHTANHWESQVAKILKFGDTLTGEKLPWPKTEGYLRLRFGELSIFAGEDGSYKSLLAGQILGHQSFNHKIAISSLEMKPEETIARIVRQLSGVSEPSEQIQSKFFEMAKENILIHDELDTIEELRCLGFVDYSARELGCKFILIDGLTKMNFPTSDGGEREIGFINRLQQMAKALGVHIMLICHTRKQGQVRGERKKDDIRGASQITNLADQIFMVSANFLKKQAIEKSYMGMELEPEEREALDMPDVILDTIKQRHARYHGKTALYLDQKSLQFKGYADAPVKHYLG